MRNQRGILPDVSKQINDLDRVVTLELQKVINVQKAYGDWWWEIVKF